MRRRLAFLAPLLPFVLAVACGGSTVGTTVTPDGSTPDGTTDGGNGTDPDVEEGPPKIKVASKVDILLVVDNSASMADKARLLAQSLPSLVKRVSATNDVHLGVISSSLGSVGGDVCPDIGNTNMRAHLSTRGEDGAPLPSASKGFLTYGPGGSVDAFAADAQSLVRGVGETGCGLEAQLEAAYRFLVQPDPYEKVTLDAYNTARLDGIDGELLAQRAAFLRPDSLVLVLMITDEDDSIPDPRAIGGQGWAFAANQFPGSTVIRADGRTTTAPRGSSTCATDPASPDCTSCGFAATCDRSKESCQKLKADPECQKNNGYWGPTEDQLGVRFHRMKERFGIDPQYPVTRYAYGFTRSRVPNVAEEHEEKKLQDGRREIGPYGEKTPTCVNPLFAAKLPTNPGDELCNLEFGTRGRDLVVFGLIGGVPPSLVSGAPQWTSILGASPEGFDYSGIDPHMIQSTKARPGLPGNAPLGDNGTDPVHGREWETKNDDLQFACTFALATPRTCTSQDPSCDCARGTTPPLCSGQGTQVRGKAYPTVRELRVAKALGDRAVVGSICEGSSYDGFVNRLTAQLTPRLTF